MKRLTKDIFIDRPDRFNFELLRKWYVRDKDGKLKLDENGNPREASKTIGWYPSFERAWDALCDLGMAEYVNQDTNACRAMIDEASENMKQYIAETVKN